MIATLLRSTAHETLYFLVAVLGSAGLIMVGQFVPVGGPVLGLALTAAAGLLVAIAAGKRDPERLPWAAICAGGAALVVIASEIRWFNPAAAVAYAASGLALLGLMAARHFSARVRASGLVLAVGSAQLAQGVFFVVSGSVPLVGIFQFEPWYALSLSIGLIVTGAAVLFAELRLRGGALAVPAIAAVILELTLVAHAVAAGSWMAVTLYTSMTLLLVMTLWLRLPITVGSRILFGFGAVLILALVLAAALTVRLDRAAVLAALAGNPEADLEAVFNIARLRGVATWGTMAIGAVAVILAVSLSRTIGRRVAALNRAATSVASGRPYAGDLQLRDGGDDLDELARAFEQMRERLATLAHAEAHRSAELASVLAAVTSHAIIGTDPFGVITLFNRGAEQMLGWDAEEMIGEQSPSTKLHDEGELADYVRRSGGGPQFETFVSSAREEPTVIQYWTYKRKDGTRLPVELGVSARRGPHGEIVGFLGIARDLTEQHQFELALTSAKSAAEGSDRAKSAFLADMSHELRTPLNAIMGFSDLLREQLAPTLSPQHKRFLGNIHVSGTHLLGLIDDLLDLSKVESGHFDLTPELIDLAALLEPPLLAVRAQAEQAGVDFELEGVACGNVVVDVRTTRQIFFNLLSNAVKFTPAPGKVTLGLALEGDALVIRVTDSGIGIPPEDAGKVFRVFERVNRARSSAPGTGLGLALTKRIIEMQGGTIAFESVLGQGTRFTVVLPHVRGVGPNAVVPVAA